MRSIEAQPALGFMSVAGDIEKLSVSELVHSSKSKSKSTKQKSNPERPDLLPYRVTRPDYDPDMLRHLRYASSISMRIFYRSAM
jgi:hypothetical protein